MRDRILHPEFFTDSKLYDAEQASGLPLRLAYAGLWCAADREGRFEWKPRELKLTILPYDQMDFAEVMQALVERGFVARYCVDGVDYGVVRKFAKWQHVHPKEAKSKLPEPPSLKVEGNGVQCNSAEPRVISPDSTSTFNSTSTSKNNGGSKKNSRVTWLTPYLDLWTAGDPPVKPMVQVLGHCRKEHGHPETLLRFGRYLNATPPQYWSIHKFKSTWNLWDHEPIPAGITDEPTLEWVD